VIGNSAYDHIPPLSNPANDAKLIAGTLVDLGFTVVGGGAQIDLSKSALDSAVQNFGRELQGADIGLFYYAGHGVQVRGANYIVPVDANPIREADVDFQMMDVNLVLRQMEGSGARLKLVILDACRNNPFGASGLREVSRGLAVIRAPEGTLISFATQPGSVALDGTDGHSPFSQALAEIIHRPDLDIFQTFNEVGLAVKRATGGNQEPWVSTSPIEGSFYLGGRSPGVVPKKPVSVTDVTERQDFADISSFITGTYLPNREQTASDVRRVYSDTVDYWGAQNVPIDTIIADKLRYFKKWPVHVYHLIDSTLDIIHQDQGRRYKVTFSYEFNLSGGGKTASGTGDAWLVIDMNGGQPIVVSEDGRVTSRR
jgi:hypothetical protein